MSQEDLYAGREQTLVKHFILKEYLERFAIIIGSRWQTITYVDCFLRSVECQVSKFRRQFVLYCTHGTSQGPRVP